MPKNTAEPLCYSPLTVDRRILAHPPKGGRELLLHAKLDESCHGQYFTPAQTDNHNRVADQDKKPDDLSDDQQLLGGDLEIDSIDILQLILEIERRFGIKLVEGGFDDGAWKSIRTLTAAVEARISAGS